MKAEIPRHDARATISLASFVAKSGRVERARGSGRSERSRDGCRIPRKPGNAGKAGGGRAGGHLLADWARPEAERAEVSSAVHQEDMVEDFVCVATRRASAGKSDIDRGSSLLFDLRFGRKGANLIWNLTFRSSYRIRLQMFERVTKFNRSASC